MEEVYQCPRELHQWVKRIKRPISDVEDVVETLITYVKKSVLDVEDVVETLITYVKKSVLLADSEDPVN